MERCLPVMQEYHLEELVNNKMIEQQLQNIHNNLVEEEIVLKAECYKDSSAGDYADNLGELKIENL